MSSVQAQVIAGYEAKGTGSVQEHNEIDLDQKAMETALGDGDFTLAKKWCVPQQPRARAPRARPAAGHEMGGSGAGKRPRRQRR